MKIAITGHRPKRLKGRDNEVYNWLSLQYDILKPEEVINGMAPGVDQLAATAAKLKGIPYSCVYPFKRELHPVEQELVDGCQRLVWLADKKFKDCYTVRDNWMVDHADVLLAVWDGKDAGGAWKTIEYAKENGKEVILFPWK